MAVGVAGAVAAPAGALSNPSVTPNPITVAPDQTVATIHVEWTGATPQQLIYIDICKKTIADPSFSASRDCAPVGGATQNGSADGSGSYELEIFRGQDPAESGWGCFAPEDTAPAGVTKYTTCYIRTTENNLFNNDADTQTPFTFIKSAGDVPEAPLTILLPVVGTLAALGGFVLVRRRQGAAV